MAIQVKAPDGSIAQFPDGMSDDAIAAVMRQEFPPQQAAPQQPQRPIIAASAEDYAAQANPQQPPQQSPSTSDYLRTNPVIGAPTQTLMRGGQGLASLGLRGVESVLPDSIRGPVTSAREGLEQGFNAENQGYEGAKSRVIGAAPDPRLTNAFIGTGETMGNLLNPAGMAGNVVKATGTGGNAALRGAISGAGYGASQPVAQGQPYWETKAGQVLTSTGVGAGTGALAQRFGQTKQAPPTTAELKTAGGNRYKQVENLPVPVTTEMQDAINGKFGKKAINVALDGAEANRETALAAELKSLLVDNPAKLPMTISANAADKVSQAFRTLGSNAMRGDNANENLARGMYGRRADVETALTAVPEIKDARGLWGQYERSKIIDETIQAAKDVYATPAGAGDMNQAMRREFLRLARNDELMSGFSQAEQDAIKATANGTIGANALQRLGKFSPVRNHLTAGVELMAAMLGGAHGGAEGAIPAIALGTAGEAARLGGIGLTNRNARLASELVRSRSFTPKPQTGPSPNVPIGNAATALLSQLLLQPR